MMCSLGFPAIMPEDVMKDEADSKAAFSGVDSLRMTRGGLAEYITSSSALKTPIDVCKCHT